MFRKWERLMIKILSIAFQGIKNRKRQTFLTIFILTISLAFAIVMMSYSSSIVTTNKENRLDTYGSWYGAIPDVQDGDLEYLESEEWFDSLGISVSYASLGNAYVGTADESFVEIGRISMRSGHLPENSTEIAMEADLLDYLGYDYTLGQTISVYLVFFDSSHFTDDVDDIIADSSEPIIIQTSFTLCGVIDEYTNLWDTSNYYSPSLNSAIISEQAAVSLYSDALQRAEELNTEIFTETGYFFTVKSGYESEVQSSVNSYLAQSRAGTSIKKKTVTINKLSFDSSEAEYNAVYVYIILTVTLFAVVTVFVLQMKSEIKRVVRMRSIGSSKRQLRFLTVVETLMMCFPSIALGILFGVLGTWLLLRLSVFAGSISVIVSIPSKLLVLSVSLWTLGVIVTKLVTLQVAFSTPLSGRMGMTVKNEKAYRKFQNVLIIMLSTSFCAVVIFTILSSLEPMLNYSYYSNAYDYKIESSYDKDANTAVGRRLYYHIDEDIIEAFSSVSGVSEVKAFSAALKAVLDFDDLDNADITLTIDSDNEIYFTGKDVSVRIINDYTQWEDIIDFSEIDIDSFNGGDSVILMYYLNDSHFSEQSVPYVGNIVSIAIKCVSTENVNNTIVEASVGAIQRYDYSAPSGFYSAEDYRSEEPYRGIVIVCSTAFLQRILDSMPEGTYWSKSNDSMEGYLAGSDASFKTAYIYTDSNVDLLTTDVEVATLANELLLDIYNVRESNESNRVVYLQTLIMLFVSGICIAIVVLIILSSTIKLETQREKRRYGILQALGMSKRQRNLELVRTALVRSVVAVVLGWGVFILTVIFRNLESIKEGGATVFGVVSEYMSNIASYYMPVWAMAVMTVALFAVVFLICYVSKLELNKYSLMEMLREDR